jgi:hypothetical protein
MGARSPANDPPRLPTLEIGFDIPAMADRQPALELAMPPPKPKRGRGRPIGYPKTGGRKVGSKSKTVIERTAIEAVIRGVAGEVLTKAQIASLSPLDMMRLCMRAHYERGDLAQAVQCAALAAPYVHARLAQTDLRVTHHDGDKSADELRAEIEAMRRAHEARTIEGTAVERAADRRLEHAD